MKPGLKAFVAALSAAGAVVVGPLLLRDDGTDRGRGDEFTGHHGAPFIADPNGTARRLLEDWLSSLNGSGSPAQYLAANYQIQRADGSGADRRQYLENPAVVHAFEIGDDLTALQANNTLAVTWGLRVTETINDRFVGDVIADRLTVFEWVDEAWRIVGYGNFNPIETLQEGETPEGGTPGGGAGGEQEEERRSDPSGPPESSVPETDRAEVLIPLEPPVTIAPVLDGSPVPWSPLGPLDRASTSTTVSPSATSSTVPVSTSTSTTVSPSATSSTVPVSTSTSTTVSPSATSSTVPVTGPCTHPGNSGNTPAVTAPGRPCHLPETIRPTPPPRSGDDSRGRHDHVSHRRE